MPNLLKIMLSEAVEADVKAAEKGESDMVNKVLPYKPLVKIAGPLVKTVRNDHDNGDDGSQV